MAAIAAVPPLTSLGDTVILDAPAANRLIARASDVELERYLCALRRDEGLAAPHLQAAGASREPSPFALTVPQYPVISSPVIAVDAACAPAGPPGPFPPSPIVIHAAHQPVGASLAGASTARGTRRALAVMLTFAIAGLVAIATFGLLRARSARIAADRAAASSLPTDS
jgi:hypothetical protein